MHIRFLLSVVILSSVSLNFIYAKRVAVTGETSVVKTAAILEPTDTASVQVKTYIKIDDIKGESQDKAAYILCPDGTMIQPGERCPEKDEKAIGLQPTTVFEEDPIVEAEAQITGYIKIGDIKGESEDKAAYILCPDGTMIQPGEKCPEKESETVSAELDGHVTLIKSQEVDCDELDNDCDGVEGDDSDVRRTKGETTIRDIEVIKEIDRSSPKLAEPLMNDVDDDDDRVEALDSDDDCDGVDNDCDGVVAEAAVKTDGHVTIIKSKDDDCDGEDDDCDGVAAEAEVKTDGHVTIIKSKDDDCDGEDNDCDGEIEERANHNTTTKPVNNATDEDVAVEVESELEVKASYILCPDGTMIQPGQLCPEKDQEVLAHELTHVVQQVSGNIDVDNKTPVLVEDIDGTLTVEVSGVESRSVFGLFPVELDVQVKLDESGNLIKVKRPWYALFSW